MTSTMEDGLIGGQLRPHGTVQVQQKKSRSLGHGEEVGKDTENGDHSVMKGKSFEKEGAVNFVKCP